VCNYYKDVLLKKSIPVGKKLLEKFKRGNLLYNCLEPISPKPIISKRRSTIPPSLAASRAFLLPKFRNRR